MVTPWALDIAYRCTRLGYDGVRQDHWTFAIMPTEVRQIRVFISSPSDVQKERSLIKETIEDASRRYEKQKISFMPIMWETHVSSDIGQDGQSIINEKIGKYDIYIGLMGERFGAKTARSEAGTLEEFEFAINQKDKGEVARVTFLFKNVDLSIGALNANSISQLQKVVEFRKRLQGIGIYREFTTDVELVREIENILYEESLNYIPVSANPLSQQTLIYDSSSAELAISAEFFRETLTRIDEYVLPGEASIILFDDIWIDPEFKDVFGEKSDRVYRDKRVSYSNFLNDAINGSSFLLYGPEKSGRSTTLMKLFRDAFSHGLVPVLIQRNDISSPDPAKISRKISNLLLDQYSNIDINVIRGQFKERLLIIFDDVDESVLDKKNTINAMKSCLEMAKCAVFSSSLVFALHDLVAAPNASLLASVIKYEFRSLSPAKRYQMVEKWCEHFRKNNSNEEIIRSEIEDKRRIIESVFRTNIVPKTPHIVLILLQAINSNQHDALLKSSSIRYYKFLIDASILKNIPRELADTAYTFLPEIAWLLHESSNGGISRQRLREFGHSVEIERDIPSARFHFLIDRLKDTGVLEEINSSVQFRHQYAYLFFLGQYIANQISEPWAIQKIKDLCESIHLQESANTLKFISFHSNVPLIQELLLRNMRQVTERIEPFSLEIDALSSINSLLDTAPKHLIDMAKIAEDRQLRLEKLETDENTNDHHGANDTTKNLDEDSKAFSTVLSSIEVLGDITKAHYARFSGDQKRLIIKESFDAGMKITTLLFDTFDESLEQLLEIVRDFADRIDAKKDLKRKEREVREIIFSVVTGFFVFMTEKIAGFVSDENLEMTFQRLSQSSKSLTDRYLSFAAKLDVLPDFPIDDLRELKKETNNNFFATRAVQLLVAHRLELRPVHGMERLQQICDAASIEMRPVLTAQLGRSTPQG